MKVHAADALILRTYRYGEADRIVVFLTIDQGKKRGVAKNATNSRRRFGGALEPFTRGTVHYVEKEGRDLVRLDRIEPKRSVMQTMAGGAGGTSADAAQVLGHASYFAELLDEWSPDNQQNERLFRLGAGVGEVGGEDLIDHGAGPPFGGVLRHVGQGVAHQRDVHAQTSGTAGA